MDLSDKTQHSNSNEKEKFPRDVPDTGHMLTGILNGNQVVTSNKSFTAEEALYLIEKRQLQVSPDISGTMILSMQQLFFLLEVDVDLYQVYCHLRQKGYHVYRNNVDNVQFQKRQVQLKNSRVIPHFSVYNINSNFRESSRGTPDFQVLVLNSSDSLDFSTIRDNVIPLKLCISNCGNIQFLSVL